MNPSGPSGHDQNEGLGKLPDKSIISCGDITCELLVNPIPRPRPKPFNVTIKPKKQQVVFFDTVKPNSPAILRRAVAILRERGVNVKDEILLKPSASVAAPEEILGKLAQEEGLVLAGIAD